jgi:hypothetical protein
MRRFAVAALLFFAVPFAARAGEGVYITLDGGYGLWGKKNTFKDRLSNQVGTDSNSGYSNTELLVERQLPDGGLFGLHLGYNIGGHIAFEGSITLRPYDILADTRGGAGITGMAARWYPLQGLVRPNRQFDISLLGGIHYILSGGNGIHGPDKAGNRTGEKLENSGRGFDGIAVEVGGTVELYPAKWVSLGITPRMYFIDPVRYFVSFDHRDAGGALPLLQQDKGGLTMMSISLSVAFHFEPLPD